jgi:hypothetical protein
MIPTVLKDPYRTKMLTSKARALVSPSTGGKCEDQKVYIFPGQGHSDQPYFSETIPRRGN